MFYITDKMTESRSIEMAVRDTCNPIIPHVSNSIENRQTEESLNNIRCTFTNINPGTTFNLSVRAERSRIFTDNISSTIEGICPLIQQAAVCIIRLLNC